MKKSIFPLGEKCFFSRMEKLTDPSRVKGKRLQKHLTFCLYFEKLKLLAAKEATCIIQLYILKMSFKTVTDHKGHTEFCVYYFVIWLC